MPRAKDIMQTHVIKVGADDPLEAVHRLFTDEEISGAPVVNETGRVVGVVTLRDLLWGRDEDDAGTEQSLDFYRGAENDDGSLFADDERFTRPEIVGRKARDVMNEGVIFVRPDAPIQEIVETVLSNRIHRVLVIEPAEDGDALVGIISLFDLVALLA